MMFSINIRSQRAAGLNNVPSGVETRGVDLPSVVSQCIELTQASDSVTMCSFKRNVQKSRRNTCSVPLSYLVRVVSHVSVFWTSRN